MGRRLALVAALLAALVAPVVSATPPSPEVLSADALLARLTDPLAAAAPLPPGVRLIQHSSHDRTGGNGDGGTFDPVTDQAGSPQWLRRDGDKFVLFDEHRPGCLTRMWFTGLDPNQGGISDFGTLEFWIDGELELSATASDVFAGTLAGFPIPVVGNYTVSSGGNYSYVPICFAESLVIAADRVKPGLGFYQLEALVAPVGAVVRPGMASAEALGAAVAALANIGTPPSPDPTNTTSGVSPSLDLAGRGTVRFLRIAVEPFTIDVLQAARLRVTADGAADAQIDVPLGSLFGDGREVRPIQSLAFGMDGDGGYLALPIPFSDGLQIRVDSASPATFTLDVWRGGPLHGPDRLYGEYRAETTEIGSDYTVLDTTDAGHLVAWVLDLVGQPHSAQTTQSYLEGDMRMFVDGSRSPSIYGTGTEDEFNGGFYYTGGPFALPMHGAGPHGVEGDRSTTSQYRIFFSDPPVWSSRLLFRMEHGASDEDERRVASTTWSYRRRSTLSFFEPVSLTTSSSLTAYFEGDRDGNVTQPFLPLGLTAKLALPPEVSSESFTADGVTFTQPLELSVPARAGCTLVLRRLRDAATTSDVGVAIDGVHVGRWIDAYSNVHKRWQEADFFVPESYVAAGTVTLTLTPAAGRTETLYDLQTAFDCSA